MFEVQGVVTNKNQCVYCYKVHLSLVGQNGDREAKGCVVMSY